MHESCKQANNTTPKDGHEQDAIRGHRICNFLSFFLPSPELRTKETLTDSFSIVMTNYLRAYSLCLLGFEVPPILRLLAGESLSAVIPFFEKGAADSRESSIVFASYLSLLCAARGAVAVWPTSRSTLLSASVVHFLEIPLFVWLTARLSPKRRGTAALGILSFILVNPFVFLLAANKAKK